MRSTLRALALFLFAFTASAAPLTDAERCVVVAAPLPAQEAPDATDWVSLVVLWLPRLGGVALALGLLLWLGRLLRSAGRAAQAAAAALVALGLWAGASALDGHPTAAAALVIGGCLASLASAALLRDGLDEIGAPVTAVWTLVAWLLGSSAAAWLAALAFAVALGADGLDHWDRRSSRLQLRATLAGLAMVAAGYGVRLSGVDSLALLVHPLWIVGLGAAFAGSALGWSWRVFDPQPRWRTVALALAATAWGVAAGQGVFAGAGGVAVVVWGLVSLVEAIPRRAPESVKLIAAGAAMLGLSLLVDAHWPLIVFVVTRGA